MLAPSPAQANKLQHLKVALTTLQNEFNAPHPQLADQQREWEQQQLAIETAGQAWQTLTFSAIKAEGGSTLTVQPNQSILASDKLPDQENYLLTMTAAAIKRSRFYSWKHCLMTRYLLVEVAELATATLC